MRRVGVIESDDFIPHRKPRMVYRRDGTQQIPSVFVSLIIQHPAAADHITLLTDTGAVVAAAQHLHFLQYVNILAGKITVSHQESGSRQRSDSSADQINLSRVKFC